MSDQPYKSAPDDNTSKSGFSIGEDGSVHFTNRETDKKGKFVEPAPAPSSNNSTSRAWILVAILIIALGIAIWFIIDQNRDTYNYENHYYSEEKSHVEDDDDDYEKVAPEAEEVAVAEAEEAVYADDYYEEAAPVAEARAAHTGNYQITGALDGKYGICMDITIDPDGSVYGSYYYTKYGIRMNLRGDCNNNHLTITDYNTDGNRAGLFDGYINSDASAFNGTYTRKDNVVFSAHLKMRAN